MWKSDCDCIDIIRFKIPSPEADDFSLFVNQPYRRNRINEWKRIIHPGEISRLR